MGTHFMLLLSIYVLYSNVTYIYPVSCLVEIKLFEIVSQLKQKSCVLLFLRLGIDWDCLQRYEMVSSINLNLDQH